MINKGDIVQCIGQVEVPIRDGEGKILRVATQDAPDEDFKVREFFGRWATLIAVNKPPYAVSWPADQLTKKEN